MRVSQIPYCQFCVDFEYTFGNSIKSPPESSFLSAGGEPATNLNTDIGTDFRIQGVHQPAATTTTYQFTSPILRLKSIPIHPLSKLKRHRDDWRYPLRLAFGSPLPIADRPVGPPVERVTPFKVSYAKLKQSVRLAAFNYHANVWNKGQTRFYLSTCAVRTKIQDQVINLFDNEGHCGDPAEMMGKSASLFPQNWNRHDMGLEIEDELEAAFHLLHHGVLINMFDAINSTLGHLGIRPHAVALWNDRLQSIHDLQMSHLLVLPFCSNTELSTSGWVGSHKVAVSKLVPYLFSVLIHELNLTGDQIRKITPCVRTAQHFYAIVSRVLSLTVDEESIVETEHFVKAFISDLTNVEEERKRKPSYLSTGNVLCLLNLPSILREYGSLRSFWDLNDEKAIQKVKRKLHFINMTSNAWRSTLLESVTREQGLVMLQGCTATTASRYAHVNFITGSSIDDITLAGDKPFACLYNFSTHAFLLPVRKGGPRSSTIIVAPLVVTVQEKTCYEWNLYHQITIDKKSASEVLEQTIVSHKTLTPCLVLPLSNVDAGSVIAMIMDDDQRQWSNTANKFVMPYLFEDKVEWERDDESIVDPLTLGEVNDDGATLGLVLV
jgi:hypothetical protein